MSWDAMRIILDGFAKKLETSQRQLDRLRDELRHIRTRIEQEEAQAPAERPIGPLGPVSATKTAEIPPPRPQPPQPPPLRVAPPPTKIAPEAAPIRPPVNWESLIGANWLNRIGVIILLVAGAFLIHLAWQRHWISPAAQVAAVFVVGVALLVGGEVFQRRNLPVFAQGLTALGILALYAGGLVGYHLHHLFALKMAFVIYVVITTTAFLMAARTNSVAVVLLGMLGGYLTPIILSTGQDALVALFTYLLFLNAAIAASAIAKRWEFLMPIAFAATAGMFLGWMLQFYAFEKRWGLETMLSLHAGLFIAAAVFPFAVLGRPSSFLSRWMLSKSTLTFFGATYFLFRAVPENHLGEFAALYGAGHWVLAAAIYGYRRQGEKLLAYLLGLGAVFVTVAVPIYFSADARAIAWAAQALVFTVIGIRYRSLNTLRTATLVFVLGLGWSLYHDVFGPARGDWGWGWFDVRFVTAVVVSVFIGGAGLAYRLGRGRLSDLPDFSSPHLSFGFAVIADLLAVAAAVHQFPDHQLALAYTANALAVCAVARWRDYDYARWFGLLLFLPAFVRFIQYQVLFAAAETWHWQIDVRFAEGLLVVAGSWVGAWLARRHRQWRDLPDPSLVMVLVGNVVLLIAIALEWEGAALTSLWALEALALAGFARWRGLPRLAWSSAVGLGWVSCWWLAKDVDAAAVIEAHPEVKTAFLSGLAITGAGWLTAILFRGREPRYLASGLALAANLVLLAAVGHQWDGYTVLALWTIDVAVLWAVGFAARSPAARAEALLLWSFVLLGWIVRHGTGWSGSLADFDLVLNARFGSLVFVGMVGLAATWAYRRFAGELVGLAGTRPCAGSPPSGAASDLSALQQNLSTFLHESYAHVWCVVVANLLLVGAMSLEANTLFDRFARHGGSPFDDLVMARQATLSILWAAYAAILFIVGFIIRYRPIRILAMVGLAPTLLKVFLVDLRHLEVIYRVLSFAVLGVVLVGVSFLYQRYRGRLGWDSGGTAV